MYTPFIYHLVDMSRKGHAGTSGVECYSSPQMLDTEHVATDNLLLKTALCYKSSEHNIVMTWLMYALLAITSFHQIITLYTFRVIRLLVAHSKCSISYL